MSWLYVELKKKRRKENRVNLDWKGLLRFILRNGVSKVCVGKVTFASVSSTLAYGCGKRSLVGNHTSLGD